MAIKEVILPSGKKAKISTGSFLESRRLLKSIEKALLKNNIKISDCIDDLQGLAGELKTNGASSLASMNISALEKIFEVIVSLDSDDNVEEAIYACFTRCHRDNKNITIETFEDIEARQDYYIIKKEVLMANIVPFFASLFAK